VSPPNQIPLQEGLYTWPSDAPQLIGSRCTACQEVTFPAQRSCAACTSDRTKDILLSRRGTLWTWTIQSFPPPSPPYIPIADEFVPFGVGYVELAEGLRIESRLTENDAEKLKIGMEMELVIEKYLEADDGSERMTFAFRPILDSA
jgi:uncharacterized OB-fold protein